MSMFLLDSYARKNEIDTNVLTLFSTETKAPSRGIRLRRNINS